MAQLDVHRNTGWHRDDIPYVVLVQSALGKVANEQLGELVVSLSADGNRIMDALDELLTRAWG